MKSKTVFTKVILFIITLAFSVSFFSCKDTSDNIPAADFNIFIHLSDPQYNKLMFIGGYLYITGGVNGIIVYRKSSDEFIALERTCPHDPKCGKVYVNENNLTAVDTVCCQSEFSLMMDGAYLSGPSEFSLRQYYTKYTSNTEILRISNWE